MGDTKSKPGACPLHRRTGVSLFEVIFALVVVLTVSGMTLATWAKANKALARSQAEAMATSLLERKLEEVKGRDLAQLTLLPEESGTETVKLPRAGDLPYRWTRSARRELGKSECVSVHCVVEWAENDRGRRLEATRAYGFDGKPVDVAVQVASR